MHSAKLASVITSISVLGTTLNAAEIRTVPETPVWIPDGVTEYKLYIRVDNTGLGGDPTNAVNWLLFNSPNFGYVAGSAAAPRVDDFFEGWDMSWELFGAPGVGSGRSTGQPGGPVDHVGNVAEYRFTVPVGTPVGLYYFDLVGDELFSGSTGNPQPHNVISDPITVLPTCLGDLDVDGTRGLSDLAELLSNYGTTAGAVYWDGDLDFDGDVDLSDLAEMLGLYGQDCP